MILAHYGIAMNDHAGKIALDKDSTAVPLWAAIAHNDTSTELTIERSFEVNAGALAQRCMQSVVRDAATPHAQRASLAPDPTSTGTSRRVDRVRLTGAASDFGLAILKEEAAASDCVSSATIDDVPRDGGLLYSHPGISAEHADAEKFVRTIADAVTSDNALLKADGRIHYEEATAASI
jgi:hypothetical protein